MKASLFITYPLRSLLRGGSPVRLAILCIAIGVMVVVTIQLVGHMATNSYTNNVRVVNGGDISLGVGDPSNPITQGDLSFLAQLKRTHTIDNYTPVSLENGAIGTTPAPFSGLLVQIVDPQQFPLVAPPTFVSPPSGSLKTLLTGNQVVVTQTFLDHYHKRIGDTFDIQVQSLVPGDAARILHVRLAGVIANTGAYPSGNTFVLVSFAEYQAANPSQPVVYTGIDITTPDQAHTDAAVRAIQNEGQKGRFPPVATQTIASIQQTVQVHNERTTQIQEIAGLLALLVGGLGIMNTMQVLLSRRTMEIAVLKTAGYSRRNLALLFGIETGILGFLGGTLGTGVAILLSYGIVTKLVDVPFVLDPWAISSGMALGTVTALIFGLMPIVQSANIRPIQVIREWSASSPITNKASTLALFGLISLLFCALTSIVLQNVLLGCASACTAELFLGGLYLCFRPIVSGISSIPIPERFMLPLPWMINTRIALRNIGRRSARATMLMLILFVGILVIGSIQLIDQDLQGQLSTTMNQVLSYNIVTKVSQAQTRKMQSQLNHLSGLQSAHTTTITTTSIQAVNGRPWQSFLTSADLNIRSSSSSVVYQILHSSDGIEGYDLANQQLPDPHILQLVAGRNLNASDAETNNVLIPYSPVLKDRLELGIGSTLTITSSDGKRSRTLTVVGEYSPGGLSLTHLEPLLASRNVVTALSTNGGSQSVFYLKVDPAKATQAAASINNTVPGVAFVTTPAGRVDAYFQVLSSVTWVFTVIGFLVLLAGIVVMANAVMLDMIERRRELGILKAVGYTQKTIRGEILLEYGIIGGMSALLVDLLVTPISNLIGNEFLRATSSYLSITGGTVTFAFGMNGLLFVCLIIGAILLVTVTSLLASWRIVQIRPLDVLRYE